MKCAAIRAIQYHVPEVSISGEAGSVSPELVSPASAADLAFQAALKLFSACDILPQSIDLLLFCTQSPDYYLPATACILQDRLGIPTHSFALDVIQGASGFLYTLSIAKALIESGQATNALVLTAETHSRWIHPEDAALRTMFRDGAAAVLVSAVPSEAPRPLLGPFVFGTDGRYSTEFIVPGSAMRLPEESPLARAKALAPDAFPLNPTLHIDFPHYQEFIRANLSSLVDDVLQQARLVLADVDHFIFNESDIPTFKSILETAGIPRERCIIASNPSGNFSSATLPIVLAGALAETKVRSGELVMLIAFGSGYSWGGGLIRCV